MGSRIMDANSEPTGIAPVYIDPANPEYPLGYWNWITFAATDFAKSAAFYDRVLGLMGYRRTMESDGHILWQTLFGAVILQPATTGSPVPAAGAPGIAQFVFHAPNSQDVDRLGRLLRELDAPITDGPRAMPDIMAGMYGVFFSDPDGTSLGLVYQPANFP
jgi:glyoxylase I family protein